MRPVVDRNVVMRRMIVYEYVTWFVTLSERQNEGVREQGAEGNIWIQEKGSKRRLEKIMQ